MKTNKTKETTNKNATGTKADAIQPKFTQFNTEESKLYLALNKNAAKGDLNISSYNDEVESNFKKAITFETMQTATRSIKGKLAKASENRLNKARSRILASPQLMSDCLKKAKAFLNGKKITKLELFGREEKQKKADQSQSARQRQLSQAIVIWWGIKREVITNKTKTSFGYAIDADSQTLGSVIGDIIDGWTPPAIETKTKHGEAKVSQTTSESINFELSDNGKTVADQLKTIGVITRGIGNSLAGKTKALWEKTTKAAKDKEAKATAKAKAEVEKAEAEKAEALQQDRMKEIFSTLLKGKAMLEFAASDMGKKELPANIKPAGMKKLIENQRQKVALLTESEPTKAGKALAKQLNAKRNELKLTEYVKPSWQVK